MPHSQSPARDNLLDTLYELFRTRGFDGVSIADISEATGLGRSSLYHHFPGGKDDMALAVAKRARAWLGEHVASPMRSEVGRERRVDAMIAGVDAMFEGGGLPCLIASMTMHGAPEAVHDELKRALGDWVDAVTEGLIATGAESEAARQVAEDAVSRIEGGLMVARASQDKKIFRRQLGAVREQLLDMPRREA